MIANGLDHVQISIQAPEAKLAERIAGTDVHEKKLDALRRVAHATVALTLNCVLHRLNHDTIEDVIAFAEGLGIARLELANVQFYGWAYRNRAALMPTLRPGSTRRSKSSRPPASACAERWRSSTFSPITSANFPNRA